MIKDYLFRILQPIYWIQIYPTDIAWSNKVKELIDQNAEVTFNEYYTINMGGYEIWVSNYPYGYGSIHNKYDILPTARVRKKLKNFIIKKRLEERKRTLGF